jgi:hypothetical protein
MKTLAEFTAFYSKQHIARLNREIEKTKDESYKKYLQEKELPSWSVERCAHLAERHYNALVNKDYSILSNYCLSMNKVLWRSISYALNVTMPTTDAELREWTMDYCGKEQALAFLERNRLAKMEKDKQAAIASAAAIITSLEFNAKNLRYGCGNTIHDQTVKWYEEGFRITYRKQGFANVKAITNESTGQYIIRKRTKGFRDNQFQNTIYEYFSHYQSQQEKINPPPEEEEEEITPEIALLFNLPSSAITTQATNISPIGPISPITPTITDRFPLLKKFSIA